MLILKKSKFTGITNRMELDVTPDQMREIERPLQNRRPIQDIVPHLNADEREFLLSGATPEEWNTLFPADDESDANPEG